MISSVPLLRAFVRGIQRLSGARCVSLYVPALRGDRSTALLVHEGPGEPVPELSDLDAAWAFLDDRGGLAGGPTDLPSQASDARLVRVPLASLPVAPPDVRADGQPERDAAQRRRREDREAETVLGSKTAWIGLRLAPDASGALQSASLLEALGHPAPPREQRETTWGWLLETAAVLGGHAQFVSNILNDPVTGLPGRAEFQHRLDYAVERAKETSRPLSVLLVNPDDFQSVNVKHGPEAGDRAIREVAGCIRSLARDSDPLARYGGAIFVILMNDAGPEVADALCRRIRDVFGTTAFLDGALELKVSCGGVTLVPGESDIREPHQLVRCADQALRAAKWAGGDCVRFWDPARGDDDTSDSLEQMSGVLTGNLTKDYRNMRLLAATVGAIAESADFGELAGRVAGLLQSTLRADRVTLFEWTDDDGPRPLGATPGDDESTGTTAPDAACVALLDRSRGHGRALHEPAATGVSPDRFAVPLVAGDVCLGCLYLEGRRSHSSLESADVVFLEALASQLAVALDRSRLADVEKQWQERERQRLRLEVEGLRSAFARADLVSESPKMEELLDTARRVAPTDATVLIRGESGTGKELLSRMIHELSPRKNNPVVVVDCAAIPATLIESELFGHERGAYTGAQGRKVGRLAEANRGTVILDEIGELPVEVQGKLLRFVQEKQVTPVGGSRVQKVDARLVAATNRDLEREVRAGSFREDLFHRLNVVRLDIPPLRERPEDVLVLARHFLKQFSAQYRKNIPCRLAPDAEDLLLRYDWPGNVRELRNRIMQAVILSEEPEIGARRLELEPASGAARRADGAEGGTAAPAPAPPVDERADVERTSAADPWTSLREALVRIYDAALNPGGRRPLPIGRWLDEDLVLEAYAAAGRVIRQGAEVVGIPEATFRRRLRKALDHREEGSGARAPFWDEVRPALVALCEGGAPAGEDRLHRARHTLLRLVVARRPPRAAVGAAIMGITGPTYRRWVRELTASEDARREVAAGRPA